jgi:hypothetical protein
MEHATTLLCRFDLRERVLVHESQRFDVSVSFRRHGAMRR